MSTETTEWLVLFILLVNNYCSSYMINNVCSYFGNYIAQQSYWNYSVSVYVDVYRKQPTNNIRVSGKRKQKMLKRLRHSTKDKSEMDGKLFLPHCGRFVKKISIKIYPSLKEILQFHHLFSIFGSNVLGPVIFCQLVCPSATLTVPHLPFCMTCLGRLTDVCLSTCLSELVYACWRRWHIVFFGTCVWYTV